MASHPKVYHNYTVPFSVKGQELNVPIYSLTLREIKSISPATAGSVSDLISTRDDNQTTKTVTKSD